MNHPCDRRTDRQTDGIAIAYARLAQMLSRAKMSLDLKIDRESLMRTVRGSELQTDGAKNRKARLQKYVLVNGSASSGMAVERRDRPQARSVTQQ